VAYNPSKKLKLDELQAIARSFGIPAKDIVDTVLRVENQRCVSCGALNCLHVNVREDEIDQA